MKMKAYHERPFKIKGHVLRFQYGESIYELDLKKSLDPKIFELTVITDGVKEVSERVLKLAGPFGNFFGVATTPRSLGYSRLYVDHEHFFDSNQVLPSLECLVR